MSRKPDLRSLPTASVVTLLVIAVAVVLAINTAVVWLALNAIANFGFAFNELLGFGVLVTLFGDLGRSR